ncbi:MAG: ribonuclease catalytic domain-containing protein [Candidatus Xenobia bacterium]
MTRAARGAAASLVEPADVVAPGSLVEFYQDRKVICGLCLKADKKGLHVLSEENREVGLSDSRVLLTVPNFVDPTSLREKVLDRLRQASEVRENARKAIVLEDLWALLSEDRRKYTPSEMAEVYFGSEVTPENVSGMVRALRDDRVWFERKGDDFVPNTPEHTQQVLASLRAEQEKESERQEMVRWFQQVWLGATCTPPPCAERYIRFLKDCAVHGSEAPRHKEMTELLKRSNISQNDGAFQVLVRAGVWDPDENLLLHKLQVVTEFSPAALAEAEMLLAEFREGSSWHQGREDLRHLHCITVDDQHTTEMDDALSLEQVSEGIWRVGVHIADAAFFVRPGSTLDREALHRATSLYFADRKINMLPPAISETICSLQQDEDRPAVSILVDVDESGQIAGSRITSSIIHVRERLDYHTVNELCEQNETLSRLVALARARRAQRIAAGALQIPFAKIEVHVSEDKQIVIERDDSSTASHVMVSECMILANGIVGALCAASGIPATYRSQDPPSEPLNIPENFGPLDAFRIRRFLKKGDLGTAPARHNGLGLEAYVQFTSPIRRYVDLVMHRQVKHWLEHGEPLCSKEQLDQILTQCSGSLDNADFMERSRRNYWIMKYLEHNTWQTHDACVLQVFHDRYVVQMTDCLLFCDCQPRADARHPAPGDLIQVRIEMVWPREGVVRLSVVS